MRCEDLDRLRAQSPGAADWPHEALLHLEGCSRCAQLQAALVSPESLEFPDALRARIEAAILPGLRPQAPLASTRRVILLLLLSAIGVMASATLLLGTAGWHARSALQSGVDFALLGVSFTFLAHSLARQMMPGSGRRGSTVSVTAALLAVVLADLVLNGYRWNPRALHYALPCLELGLVTAAVASPIFWLALRRGLFLNRVTHGFLAGLLGGITGMAVLEIHCPYLDRLHIAIGHLGAAATVALLGSVWGVLRGAWQRRSA